MSKKPRTPNKTNPNDKTTNVWGKITWGKILILSQPCSEMCGMRKKCPVCLEKQAVVWLWYTLKRIYMVSPEGGVKDLGYINSVFLL